MKIADLKPLEFRALLDQTADIISRLYTDIDRRTVYHTNNSRDIRSLFNEDLPASPTPIDQLLDRFESDIAGNVAIHYSPHFYAWVTSNASQAALIGEFLATALNVNATTWLNAAAASEIEQRVIAWIGQFIEYHDSAAGVLLSGGSMANLSGLLLAITHHCPYDFAKYGIDRERPLRIYASEQSHFSIQRAVLALGLGTANLIKIKTLADFSIDGMALRQQIEADLDKNFHPICVFGNAGTVNTGAVDALDELGQICREYKLWLHVDAAYGGFAASTGLRSTLFKGLEMADSIAIDLHKWLFVPFECAALVVKERSQLKQAFRMIPEYQQFAEDDTRVDFSELSLQQSRRFRALKAWMTFKAYGTQHLRASILHSVNLMSWLADEIEKSTDFQLISRSQLSIVCFQYIGRNGPDSESILNELNQQLIQALEADGRVFIQPTILNGKRVLRACCTNFRREQKDVLFLLNVLRELGEAIEREIPDGRQR